jgi:hypothetical protein
MKRSIVRTMVAGSAVLCLTAALPACGGSSSPSQNSGVGNPDSTINGRRSPDVNGNNRDQPPPSTDHTTSPVTSAP